MRFRDWLEQRFRLSEAGTTERREVLAGATTFLGGTAFTRGWCRLQTPAWRSLVWQWGVWGLHFTAPSRALKET